MLSSRIHSIDVPLAMKILRSHGKKSQSEYDPSRAGLFEQSVCMHYSGGIRRSQTTGSVIAHLALPNVDGSPDSSVLDVLWVTGTSSPCISSFKPLLGIDSLPVDLIGFSEQSYDTGSFWWKGEELHRLVLLNYSDRAPVLQLRNRNLESYAFDLVNRFFTTKSTGGNWDLDVQRKILVTDCFHQSIQIMTDLTAEFSRPVMRHLFYTSVFALWYRWNWRKCNQLSFVHPLQTCWQVWAIPKDLLALSVFGVGFVLLWKFYKRR